MFPKYSLNDWREGSAVRGSYCSCKGHKSECQHSYQAVYNGLGFLLHGYLMPLASEVTCTHVCTCKPAHIPPPTCTQANRFSKLLDSFSSDN